jgi:hypothetical protein
VRLCEQPLTLIDVGGVVDEKNEWIARHASHAVLIAAQAQDLVVWRDFCDRLNLRLVAELHRDSPKCPDSQSRDFGTCLTTVCADWRSWRRVGF